METVTQKLLQIISWNFIFNCILKYIIAYQLLVESGRQILLLLCFSQNFWDIQASPFTAWNHRKLYVLYLSHLCLHNTLKDAAMLFFPNILLFPFFLRYFEMLRNLDVFVRYAMSLNSLNVFTTSHIDFLQDFIREFRQRALVFLENHLNKTKI